MTNAPIDIYVRDNTNDLAIFNEVFGSNTYSADLIDYTTINTVHDLGAHIGRYVKEKNAAAHIVAVEPDYQNAVCFLFNLTNYSRVTLITARVAYAWLDVQVIRTTENSGGIGFVPSDSPNLATLEAGAVSVPGSDYPVVTLEQLGPGEIDLLKIDIEGAEFDVLLNAPLSTIACYRWIVGEYHGASGSFGRIVDRLAPAFELRRQEDTGGGMGYFCFERRH